MPYTENHGVRIHYRVVGAGKPLVLHHGFTESIEDWSECGYVDALQSEHELILIDARGHGAVTNRTIHSPIHWKRASAT
jgi:pimeloyl-ACP methyl ester carboxylesterase